MCILLPVSKKQLKIQTNTTTVFCLQFLKSFHQRFVKGPAESSFFVTPHFTKIIKWAANISSAVVIFLLLVGCHFMTFPHSLSIHTIALPNVWNCIYHRWLQEKLKCHRNFCHLTPTVWNVNPSVLYGTEKRREEMRWQIHDCAPSKHWPSECLKQPHNSKWSVDAWAVKIQYLIPLEIGLRDFFSTWEV